MEFLWIRSFQTLSFVPSIDDWPLSSFHERNSLAKKRSVRASLFFFFLKLERFACTAQQTRRKSGCSCFNTVHGTNDRSIDRYDTAAKGSVFRGVPRGSDKTRRDDSARMWTRGGARHDAVGDAVLGDAATRHEDFRAHRASVHWTRRGRWSRSCPCPRAGRSPRPACRGQPASSSSPRCRRLRPAPPRSFVSSGTRSPVHKQTCQHRAVTQSFRLIFFCFCDVSKEKRSCEVLFESLRNWNDQFYFLFNSLLFYYQFTSWSDFNNKVQGKLKKFCLNTCNAIMFVHSHILDVTDMASGWFVRRNILYIYLIHRIQNSAFFKMYLLYKADKPIFIDFMNFILLGY